MPKLNVLHRNIVMNNEVIFDLPTNNYDSLRTTNILVPRILIIVLVPEQVTDWVNVMENETLVKKCAYWLSLRGMLETKNKDTVRVKIPRSNLVTPNSLKELTEKVARSENI